MGPPSRRAAGVGAILVRGMLVIWAGVIVAGLVFFTIVGLTHH
jgi:hypothetical protein